MKQQQQQQQQRLTRLNNNKNDSQDLTTTIDNKQRHNNIRSSESFKRSRDDVEVYVIYPSLSVGRRLQAVTVAIGFCSTHQVSRVSYK